jgi:hypothetical protein
MLEEHPNGTLVWAPASLGPEAAGFSIASDLEMRPGDVLEFAGRALETVHSVERLVTSELEKLAAQSGGRMAGLEWAVKGQESLARKIATMVENGEAKNPYEALSKIHDTLRYTMNFEAKDYAAGIENALAGLRERGFSFNLSDVENSWRDRPEYHGINSNMRTPDGHWMELQFHTPASFDTKEHVLHPLYEEYRLPATSAERRKELKDEMTSITAKLEKPPGVDAIGVHVGGRARAS